MAKIEEGLHERLAELIAEEEALGPLEAAFNNRQDALKTERATVLFDATVVGDRASQQRLTDINTELEVLRSKFEAIDSERIILLTTQGEVRKEISDAEVSAGLKLGGKYEEQMVGLAKEAKEQIVAASNALVKLRELSVEAQNRLTEAGLTNNQMRTHRWRTLRNEFSPLIVLAFGRIAKLNLNSAIGHSALRWWEGEQQ